MEDLEAALGPPHTFFSEGANLWGRFKQVTSVYGATFQTSSSTPVYFFFEYQECVRQIMLNKNIR